jgi:tetratricopeptide (TPR) repeat protein
MTGDGTQEGVRGGDVNWEFGRTLLDGVANVRQDRDVESWYVGTMAYLLDVEHFDNPHFDHAERLFPRSAEIRYLGGCLHEALAGPRVQSVLEELRVPRRTSLDVRSERPELNDADERFRAALESAPQHHEARLRHGRVLGRLGRHEEAVSELRTALPSLGEPLLRYYAAMFLGADEEALGRLEAAREMYEQAAALFPRAQAPQLALSQLEHRRGDRMRARTVLAPALRGRDRQLDDPWWKYYVSCGRNAEAQVQATYRSIHGQPQ